MLFRSASDFSVSFAPDEQDNSSRSMADGGADALALSVAKLSKRESFGAKALSKVSKVIRQFCVLMIKNALMAWRNWKSTLLQCCVSSIFVFLMVFLYYAIFFSDSTQDYTKVIPSYPAEDITKIPRCTLGYGTFSCYTMAYIPDDDDIVRAMVYAVADDNDIPRSEVIGFGTLEDLDKFLYQTPNVTQAAYIFNPAYGTFSTNISASGNMTINYAIQFNNTRTCYGGRYDQCVAAGMNVVQGMQYSMDKYILGRQASIVKSQLSVELIPFPRDSLRDTPDVIAVWGGTFFFAAAMFTFVVQLGMLVMEKERKLREAMRIFGLIGALYWISWWLTFFIINQIGLWLMIFTGLILQLDFFIKTDFMCYFLLFFLFGLSTISMVFLFSTIVQKSRSATTLGFVIFILLDITNGSASAIVYRVNWDFWLLQPLRYFFAFFPSVMFDLGISDLGEALENNGSGLKWSEIDDNQKIFPFGQILMWIAIDAALYMLAAIYLDLVVPGEYGTTKSPWFFLTPSYWFGKGVMPPKASSPKFLETDDEDIREAADVVLRGEANDPLKYAVVIENLEKTYQKYPFMRSSKDFTAVDHVCYAVPSNQLFCLLGPNGAGKSTSIGVLTGLFGCSSGDAYIFGHSIRREMNKIRQVMGVCPQHDILWDELTAKEHILIFSGFKDIPINMIGAEIRERLDDVQLLDVGDQKCGEYSGGMRRRLSVAISLTGNPGVVFLDEPTTGMDPVARRHVWNIIERAKKGRAIVLTTHSMEEADVLGDTIAIMGKGRLRAFGSALHLKNKHGTGFVVSVAVNTRDVDPETGAPCNISKEELAARRDAVVVYFAALLPQATVESMAAGYIQFVVSGATVAILTEFFTKLEGQQEELKIVDFSVHMTSLEEVFIAIAKTTEIDLLASGEEEAEELDAPVVPTGDNSMNE